MGDVAAGLDQVLRLVQSEVGLVPEAGVGFAGGWIAEALREDAEGAEGLDVADGGYVRLDPSYACVNVCAE